MNNDELRERLHELQVDLKDGDDLAKAIGLIGDALERRMTDIRDDLKTLRDDHSVPDRERLHDVVDRVAATLDTYEEKLEERRQRMEDLVDEFHNSLGEEAQVLGDLEAELGGSPPSSDEGHLPGGD